MKTLTTILLMASLAFPFVSLNASSMNEGVREYCQGMGEGLSDDDAREMIAQCMEEQSQYYDDDSSAYEEEPAELDCYEKADISLEQNPDADYDTLVQNCLDQES